MPWKTSKQQLLVCPCAGCMVCCAEVHGSRAGLHEATPSVRIMQFFTLFQAFFRLAMPWNFKYLLRTIELQSSYPRSFT